MQTTTKQTNNNFHPSIQREIELEKAMGACNFYPSKKGLQNLAETLKKYNIDPTTKYRINENKKSFYLPSLEVKGYILAESDNHSVELLRIQY